MEPYNPRSEKSGRLLIVSNRLPVVIRREGAGATLDAASGGLASGLRTVHATTNAVWMGWPGEWPSVPQAERARIARQLRNRRIVPVPISTDEVRDYYDSVCNAVLWPLFHYHLDRVPVETPGWAAYRTVNARFADAIVREYRDGDRIWIHDYHLFLTPALIRARLPQARIGFFLHIPFPAAEVFQAAPWRREILDGLLGADLIGFHTRRYVTQFEDAVQSLTPLHVENDVIRAGNHLARTGAYPIGVDAAAFARMVGAAEPDARRFTDGLQDQRLLLGVDRLDYTKGIARRLLAYAQLLRANPDLRGRVRLVQVAVPSRENVAAYQQCRREIEELVGRINGEFATVDWTPIRYLHQSISPAQLVHLYRSASVMLVTPLRDGMNLVAKEFVASRTDRDGVLVLSECAGAADELREALSVNPYDVDGMSAAMKTALSMDRRERMRRMSMLREGVIARDACWWASSFLDDLDRGAMATRDAAVHLRPSSSAA